MFIIFDYYVRINARTFYLELGLFCQIYLPVFNLQLTMFATNVIIHKHKQRIFKVNLKSNHEHLAI